MPKRMALAQLRGERYRPLIVRIIFWMATAKRRVQSRTTEDGRRRRQGRITRCFQEVSASHYLRSVD
jgi:hypothetical protein